MSCGLLTIAAGPSSADMFRAVKHVNDLVEFTKKAGREKLRK
jgi:hypothetical protein